MDDGKSPPQKGNGKVLKQNNTGKKKEKVKITKNKRGQYSIKE